MEGCGCRKVGEWAGVYVYVEGCGSVGGGSEFGCKIPGECWSRCERGGAKGFYDRYLLGALKTPAKK